MKAIEQYFIVVLFVMLCKVVLTFEFVDEILKCDHSYEGYWVALFKVTTYCFPIFCKQSSFEDLVKFCVSTIPISPDLRGDNE